MFPNHFVDGIREISKISNSFSRLHFYGTEKNKGKNSTLSMKIINLRFEYRQVLT